MSMAESSWPELSADEQQELLRLARFTLDRFLVHRELIVEPPAGMAVGARLRCAQGAFVSLHRGQELRGCVGFPEPTRPLVEAVMDNVIGAAGRDPRFPPVTPAELPEIAIEVSALGILGRVQPADVEAGRHGVMVEYQGRRGLLLPQVAIEHGWTRTDLLRQVCIKAGLAADVWQRPETRLYGFTAQVFHDSAWRVQIPPAILDPGHP